MERDSPKQKVKCMKVKIGDFVLTGEEKKAVVGLLEANTVSEGRKCREFESAFASFIGTAYCASANSGTSALMLIMASLKYHSKWGKSVSEKGNRVLTSPLTYIATSNSIATTGFEPVFSDIELETFAMDAEKAKEAAEKEDGVCGMMPVHLMGYPADMDALNSIAAKHGWFVVEDSAEATGSIYRGRRTGSIGTAGAFSFYIAHNIQVGEFGAITSGDRELVERAHRLKGNGRICYCAVSEVESGRCPHQNLGFNPRYLHDMIGYNFKPMEYQAAVGLEQLKKIEWIIKCRQHNVKVLNDLLAPIAGEVRLPRYSEEVSYLGYPLLAEGRKMSRNRICLGLNKAGIENRPIFNSIPTQQPAYAHLKKKYEGLLPNAEFVGNCGFYVGCHQFLKQEQLEYAAKSIIAAVRAENSR